MVRTFLGSFDEFKEPITVEKPDGRRFETRAIFSKNKFTIDDVSIPLEEDDVIHRPLGNGMVEQWVVTDRGYFDGGQTFESHFQAKVKRPSRSVPARPPSVVNVNFHGAVQGSNVNAGTGTQNVVKAAIQTQPTAEALASLREEIVAVQDLHIGNKKQILELEERLPEVQAMLTEIADEMERRLLGQGDVTPEQLQLAAGAAVEELQGQGKVDAGLFRRIFSSPITQNVISSAVFEALVAVASKL